MPANAAFQLTDCTLLDTRTMRLVERSSVLVRGERIVEVAQGEIKAADAARLACRGRVLMPGLIDAHAHVTIVKVDPVSVLTQPQSLTTAMAARIMHGMLMRGFTSVRDAGGADSGLARAVEAGLFSGPRLFVSGRALSQTGGHADLRHPVDAFMGEPCGCAHLRDMTGRIADGVSEVRRAARDEIRLGAHQIKVMASGGVASPTDPITVTQYSMEELRAIVEEAEAAETYVMAHAYAPRAIRRAVEAGIRSVEHGNLLDEATAQLMAARGAYLVPTLATYQMLASHGRDLGFPPVSLAKLDTVLTAGTRSLEIAKRAGVKMGFGTDLLGELHEHESIEFAIRAEVLSPAEIIASATIVNAEMMMRDEEIGVVAPGAFADLLVVDGNPLEDLGLLQDQGAHLALIMKSGQLVKNAL